MSKIGIRIEGGGEGCLWSPLCDEPFVVAGKPVDGWLLFINLDVVRGSIGSGASSST